MKLNENEMACLKSEHDVDFDDNEKFMKLVFNKCYEKINMYVRNPVYIKFKVDLSSEDYSIINARASEKEYPIIGVEYSYWLLMNKFYNTVFSKQNENFFKLITYLNEYKENEAKYWSVFMKKLTLEVIIFHELGHIYGGHLKKGSTSISYVEENNQAKHEKNIMYYQAREIDADRFAAYNLVSYYVSDSTLRSLKREYNVNVSGKEHMLIVLVIASILAFSFLGAGRDGSQSQKDFKEMDHFPSRYRAFCYYHDMIKAYNKNYCEQKVEALSTNDVITLIKNVEKWFDFYMRDVIQVANWSPENNDGVFNEEHMKYYEKVFKYMEEDFKNEINQEREGLASVKDIFISPEK